MKTYLATTQSYTITNCDWSYDTKIGHNRGQMSGKMSKRRKRSDRDETSHDSSCRLHQTLSQVHCVARLRDGFTCYRRVNLKHYDPSTSWMPTCSYHRNHRLKAGRCVAVQQCGFPCGRLIPWNPPEFQLCSLHIREATCHFMRLPTELRQEIYRYLLPDQPIPAWFTRPLRTSGRVQTAILRVSRQIYSEAVVILYQHFKFGISITPDSVTICNINRTRLKPQLIASDHDFDTLVQSREGLRKLLSRLNTGIASSLYRWDNFPIDDSIWCRIRSFKVEVILGVNHRVPRGQGKGEAVRVALCCDMVRRVVERFQSIGRIKELEIIIRPGQWEGCEALGAAAILLRQFYSMPNPRSLKISVIENDFYSFSGFSSTEGILSKNPVFQRVVETLQDQMASSQTKAPLPLTRHRHVVPLAALMKIETLVQLFSHPLISGFLCLNLFQMINSLHANAIHARETGNLPAFREVCDQIEKLVVDFSERQLSVQRRISEGVGTVRQIIERSPLCPELSAEQLKELDVESSRHFRHGSSYLG